MSISAPTGITTTVYQNKAEVRWIKNPELNVKGYNIYNSTTSGGGISGYAKLNNILITEFSETKKEVLSSTTEVTDVGGHKTTVIEETYSTVYIYLYVHQNLLEDKPQYYVITAVDNLGEESAYSIEVTATPLLIPTNILSSTVRSENDISLDYITELLDREPKLDVKPGSVTRQLHIDPNAHEISYSYIREDFISRSQSFLTLRKLDDADGDNISDPVADSTYKLQLKEAFFIDTDEDLQAMIDFKFDQLAANYGIFRKEETNSTVTSTFWTDIAPTKSITILKGTRPSTIPTELTQSVVFETLAEVTLDVNQLSKYFNALRNRYEISVETQAIDPGSIGNVGAGTVISSPVSGLNVTNLLAALGGTDRESNSSLADRAQYALVGLDVGTAYGYKRTAAETPNVLDAIVVTAGNKLMQRDYDEVRQKHVFGKVDVYIMGGTQTQYQDFIGFLFNQKIDDPVDVFDIDGFTFKSVSTDVSATKNIFNVENVTNVSKGKIYDLLGNWIIYKNNIAMLKQSQVKLDLSTGLISFVEPLITGDVITAKYDYRENVLNEIIINAALGGEVSASLDHQMIVKKSYTIYKNDIILVENVDYTINLLNGFIQLTNPLVSGNKLSATYDYTIKIFNTPEIVISNAAGGEVDANLLNDNILQSLWIEDDGISFIIDKNNIINDSIGLSTSDIVTSTYRYHDSSPIILQNQPADTILSVEGSDSGLLQENVNYKFNNIDDILLEGNSVKAQRSIQILYDNGIPNGNVFDFTENVTLIDNEFKELSNKGIDTESIVIRNGSTIYFVNSDYLIKKENEKNVSISRSVTSSIPNGSTVTVDYSYGEILTITYTSNPLVKIVQDKINVDSHIAADVLVKEVLKTFVDYELAVVLESLDNEIDETTVKLNIKDAISKVHSKLKVGNKLAQSDIVHAIEEVDKVSSVLLPLTKMVKADYTRINREQINSEFIPYQASFVNSYSTGQNALIYKTLGSNSDNGFYAVYEDDIKLNFVTDANEVDSASGQAFISENGEVIISTINSDQPNAHTYSVSYIVYGESGAKNIPCQNLEYLVPGNIVVATSITEA